MTLSRRTFSDFFNESPLISRTNSVEFDSIAFHQLLDAHARPSLDKSLLIVLVGLPACGKSTVAKYLVRYLQSQHISAKIYNAGNVRRAASSLEPLEAEHPNRMSLLGLPSRPSRPSIGAWQSSSFFKDNNQLRDKFAFVAFERCMLDIINNKVSVGIFDATNSTVHRRSQLNSLISLHLPRFTDLKVLMLDVKCTNMDFWKFNMELKVSSSPDYVGKDHEAMSHKEKLTDFVARTKNYVQQYEPVSFEELDSYAWDYMVLDNCGEIFQYRQAAAKPHNKPTQPKAYSSPVSAAALRLALEDTLNILANLDDGAAVSKNIEYEPVVPAVKQVIKEEDEEELADQEGKDSDGQITFSVPRKYSRKASSIHPSNFTSIGSASPSSSSSSSCSSSSCALSSSSSVTKIQHPATSKVYQFLSHYFRSIGASYVNKAKRFNRQPNTAGSILTRPSSRGAVSNDSEEASTATLSSLSSFSSTKVDMEDMDVFKILFDDQSVKSKLHLQ